MATDTNLLQGEVIENPEDQELDVERFLGALLSALLAEQREAKPATGGAKPGSGSAPAQGGEARK